MAPGPGGDGGLGEETMSRGEKEGGVRGYDGKAGKWDSHRLRVRVCARLGEWEAQLPAQLLLPTPALTLRLHRDLLPVAREHTQIPSHQVCRALSPLWADPHHPAVSALCGVLLVAGKGAGVEMSSGKPALVLTCPHPEPYFVLSYYCYYSTQHSSLQ